MTKETEAPELDMRLVHEFEYRKKKIELIEEGKKAIANVQTELENEYEIGKIREVALLFAQQGINLAIENVDNAIVAFASVRKANTAQNAMKFLWLLLLLSNALSTGIIVWLILR